MMLWYNRNGEYGYPLITDHDLMLLLTATGSQSHQDLEELTSIRHPGIRIDLHSVTHQNQLTVAERRLVSYPSSELAFHKTAFSHTNKAWLCAWKRQS